MPNVKFTVLDRVHIPPRGGDWNKTLLQRKMCWIRYLKATTPPGLNEVESFRPFLEAFNLGKTDLFILDKSLETDKFGKGNVKFNLLS